MLRKYLACMIVSLFVLGNLNAMEEKVAAKNTAFSAVSLEEKIANNEKIVAQIQKLTEQLDKDAAANMVVRSWQKQFYLLNEEMGKSVNSFLENSKKNELPLGQIENDFTDNFFDVFSRGGKESLQWDICNSVISDEARRESYEVFLKTYNQYVAENIKRAFRDVDIKNLENLIGDLTERFVSSMDDAVNIAAQATADVLSKYYKIDFEFLGLKTPEKPKTNTVEKK